MHKENGPLRQIEIVLYCLVFRLSVLKPNPKQSLWPITKDADNHVNQSKLATGVTMERGETCVIE